MGAHCSERHLVDKLRDLGFEGPVPGGHHKKMTRDGKTVAIPNTHGSGQLDICAKLLFKILREGGVTKDEWRQN
ncbi:MAG: hypothetical protein Greene07147_267 [Parcubacteria group bacterium Greene0714_7]|nr:MAG: hypothetical protein Greene07147_267 [Parcubacteria group bacterium Greene0714_7]